MLVTGAAAGSALALGGCSPEVSEDGTISGDMFAGSYNFMMPGHNLGANCVTFGYLAGKAIAKQ